MENGLLRESPVPVMNRCRLRAVSEVEIEPGGAGG
jgi:hypothetical protein